LACILNDIWRKIYIFAVNYKERQKK